MLGLGLLNSSKDVALIVCPYFSIELFLLVARDSSYFLSDCSGISIWGWAKVYGSSCTKFISFGLIKEIDSSLAPSRREFRTFAIY